MSLFTSSVLPLISREPGAICFACDDVEPVTDRLTMVPAIDELAARTERQLLVTSACGEKVAESAKFARQSAEHPLVNAVYRAFSEHRPLRISPDDVALVIAQGVAHHIHCHAETLRARLVDFDGRGTIVVETEQAETAEDWQVIVELLSSRVRELVNPEIGEALRCDFTTSTPAARVAAEIALLQGFNRYFDYVVYCVCGIPRITLTGTPDDWQRLRERVSALEALEMGWWTNRLVPILSEMVATAEGRPDRTFWQAICKPKEVYGANVITGWLADLFPYLNGHGGQIVPNRRNPALEWPRNKWALEQGPGVSRFSMKGIEPCEFPNGLAEAPFTLQSLLGSCPLTLIGGFIGLAQAKDGTLAAEVGWAVGAPNPIETLLHRLEKDHHADVRRASPQYPEWSRYCPCAVAFATKFDRVALFPGSENEWVLGNYGPVSLGGRWSVAGVIAVRKDGLMLVFRLCDEMDGSIPVWDVYTGRAEFVPLPDSFEPLILESPVRLQGDPVSVLTHLLDFAGQLPPPHEGGNGLES